MSKTIKNMLDDYGVSGLAEEDYDAIQRMVHHLLGESDRNTMPGTHRMKRIAELVKERNPHPRLFERLVHVAVGSKAYRINNLGIDAQLEYLQAKGYYDEVILLLGESDLEVMKLLAMDKEEMDKEQLLDELDDIDRVHLFRPDGMTHWITLEEGDDWCCDDDGWLHLHRDGDVICLYIREDKK